MVQAEQHAASQLHLKVLAKDLVSSPKSILEALPNAIGCIEKHVSSFLSEQSRMKTSCP
jgi:hypothetical protein